jgi:carbon monoxide dehydrogenase subunit G
MTKVNVGDWTFTPEGDKTRVRYRICTDAGGRIPQWMGEFAATRTLPTNVADLIRSVKKRLGVR